MDRWRLRKGNGHQSDRRYRAFIGSRFYVRKEILCVLTNFKNIYQSEFDTGKVVNKQFVLMGSPGTGKSCILALMCFYIAVHHKRPPEASIRPTAGSVLTGWQAGVYEKKWFNMYKLRGNSGQFSPKSEAIELIMMCLVRTGNRAIWKISATNTCRCRRATLMLSSLCPEEA
ncbi:hypothetical protein GQ600_1274 [Phytophthora cactorum]|nr:hypothetical protein GQ600_1274 [Phytophthora cactorum]